MGLLKVVVAEDMLKGRRRIPATSWSLRFRNAGNLVFRETTRCPHSITKEPFKPLRIW